MLRITSGILAAILLVLIIYLGNIRLLTSVTLFCLLIAAMEYNRLFFETKNLYRDLVFSIVCLFFVILIKNNIELVSFFIWTLFAVFGVFFVINNKNDFSTALNNFFIEIFGVLYLVSIFGFIIPIFSLRSGRDFLFFMFFNIALSDSAAYFIGLNFGKHKLVPKISPNKSIEGSIASLITSVLSTLIWIFYIYKGEKSSYFISSMLIFSLILNFLAQFGDLFESIIKRSHQVKDSGFFLPGHGGILDRTDSFTFIAPIYYFYLNYLVLRMA